MVAKERDDGGLVRPDQPHGKQRGRKGKTWLELARLRGELERTQDDRTEAVRGLGEKVYQQIRAGGLVVNDCMPTVAHIQELDLRASQLGQQIAALESPSSNQRGCASCGQINAPGDAFCVSCGSRLQAPQAQVAAKCVACGAEIKDQARFCVSCGNPSA